MQQCPKVLLGERRFGKKADAIEQTYLGPPEYVTWGLIPEEAAGSNTRGYVEFGLLSRKELTPESAWQRFYKTNEGIAYLVTAVVSWSVVTYRYEFQVTSGHLHVVRMLDHAGSTAATNSSQWFDVRSKGDACWEKAALDDDSNPVVRARRDFSTSNVPTTPEDVAKLKVQAASGDADAEWKLGVAYGFGARIPRDDNQSVVWFRRSADQGNPIGELAVGMMCVDEDPATAAVWLLKSAEQGDPDAQYSLGALYEAGKGVPQDFKEAYFWLSLASSGKTEFDANKVTAARDSVAALLEPAVLLEVQKRARKWFEDHPANVQ